MSNNILETKGITKLFPGVTALDGVDIAFSHGQIHAIIGENGAGKSTLIKCLTGVLTPESGSVIIDGQDALKNKKLFNKVAYVPQEINLFPNMSVAENLFLPYEKTGHTGFIDADSIKNKSLAVLKNFGIPVSPTDIVKDISASSKQLIQIARATLYEDYEVLLLDEPTTSLTENDTNILFSIIREIKSQGKCIIFISHKLEEIFELSDVITVLRNGRKVAFSPVNEVDIPWVIHEMTGHNMDMERSYISESVSDEILLDVRGLFGKSFKDISFSLKKGEILGFYGLVGSGRSELMQAILGILPIYSGTVKIEGKELKTGDPNLSVSEGFVYLPEERKNQGIFPDLSVKENISISALSGLCDGLSLSKKKEDYLAQQVIETYDVKTPDAKRKISFLSGGNQQKILIGRAMSAGPKILVFDEPTKGIDIGTKTEIYSLMKKLAEENGIGIIIVSSEMREIIKCSNRIICLYEGCISGEFGSNPDEEKLISAIMGVV